MRWLPALPGWQVQEGAHTQRCLPVLQQGRRRSWLHMPQLHRKKSAYAWVGRTSITVAQGAATQICH